MKVLLTGAAGGMGLESLKQMAEDGGSYQIVALDLDTGRCRERLKPYEGNSRVKPLFGDLTDAAFAESAVKGCDLILHVAAFVSPAADYYPKKVMEVNFGGTRNLIEAVKKLGQNDTTRFVYIGTVAETGDRMPPIHWGRVGDPIKLSMFDYYAVSKIAAERYVIESGLKHWVSLRQTGIIGLAMAKIRDAIQFHNCLDNVLEYVSDRDSGRLMCHLAAYTENGALPEAFWGHIYNIGGGQRLMGAIIKSTFKKLLNSEHGTKHFIDANMEDHIDAYWGSRKRWEALPEKASQMNHFTDWDKVVPIDHGYDESKPESELTLSDLQGAAKYRGGACLSESMKQGDWQTKQTFRCAFGHTFKASPRLILEGGHWCPECERKSWNYGARAKVDPFFAQVWNPLHGPDETREYPKEVTELDV